MMDKENDVNREDKSVNIMDNNEELDDLHEIR